MQVIIKLEFHEIIYNFYDNLSDTKMSVISLLKLLYVRYRLWFYRKKIART